MPLIAQQVAQQLAALMKTIRPFRQYRRWRRVGKSRQEHRWIDGTSRSFEDTANSNHADHPILAHEAVFQESPLAVPSDQARVDLEGLEYPEIVTELGDRVADHRERPLSSCKSEHAGTHEPIDATDVGERKIPAVVDVQIQIQVVGPGAQTDTRGRE